MSPVIFEIPAHRLPNVIDDFGRSQIQISIRYVRKIGHEDGGQIDMKCSIGAVSFSIWWCERTGTEFGFLDGLITSEAARLNWWAWPESLVRHIVYRKDLGHLKDTIVKNLVVNGANII